jgi:ABC-type multidrug transport system fused ATPase/permease subunit
VADNIRFYRDIDDAAVREAARLARIDADIESWANGYETIIGPRADAISGGQQQRICIARALAGAPEVLILDEPTSALDPNSESLLQESLRALKDRLTLFVVAHRMSTLDICSRVMVIVDGRLIDFDTPSRLSVQSGYYRSAWAIASGAPPTPTPATTAPDRTTGTFNAAGNGSSRLAAPSSVWVRRRG